MECPWSRRWGSRVFGGKSEERERECVYIYIYVYTHIDVYKYIHIHIYIYTYLCTHFSFVTRSQRFRFEGGHRVLTWPGLGPNISMFKGSGRVQGFRVIKRP